VRSNCRYGPGAPYLYKVGLRAGTPMDIIGRTDLGNWLLIRAAGGTSLCWIKASLMEIDGDVMSVQPTYVPLPSSPYYGPLRWANAVRNGDEVIINWAPFSLRPGDEHASPPYLLEVWVCVNGQLTFIPIGTYQPYTTVLDEQGCPTPSHGRVFAVEKHGYTRWVEIPWPDR
jgi:hypothetical protein